MNFSGKVAMITGATRGIGRAATEIIIANGGKVIATGGTGAAAVAFILIDLDDPSFHFNTSLFLWLDYSTIKSTSQLNFQRKRIL